MFLSANEPGNIKKVQASVTAARKVFRVMRVSAMVQCGVRSKDSVRFPQQLLAAYHVFTSSNNPLNHILQHAHDGVLVQLRRTKHTHLRQ